MQHATNRIMREEAPAAVPPPRLVMEAIARRIAVAATYNGTAAILAPHVLYTRASQLYLGAVTIDRDGVPPRESRLGIFKLDGLSDLRLTERAFVPARQLFDPRDPRFADTTLFAVEI